MAIIMHIDLNAFFAAAEVLRNPSLKGKPIAIGHEGRSGIVSTCSYEARKFGVHSGQPTFQAKRLCPQLLVIEPHFSYYHMLSRSFFAMVAEVSPIIEIASVDECYVDMTKVLSKEKDPIAFCRNLQFRLQKEMGLTCSIGLAPTKWLAKMASDMKKPMGLTIIRKRDIPSVLYPLPIESFWGIGKKTAPRLREIGITTIGDFARRAKENDPLLQQLMGKFFFTASSWVQGGGSSKVETEPWDPKSCGVSTTLGHDCQGFAEIEHSLRDVCEEVSSRAKREGKQGYGMALQIKDTSFKVHSKHASFSKPSNDASLLFEEAKRLYQAHFEDYEVRLIGVTLERLVDPKKEVVQMSFWDYEQYEKMDKTKLLIEQLNRKLDEPALMRGSEAKKK
ncbi:MAG: DNA polymerase IV [Bacilli bacterium]|nr:DNA polymerase IV [Bacilli bacterium]